MVRKTVKSLSFYLLAVIACIAWKGMESCILVIVAHLKHRK